MYIVYTLDYYYIQIYLHRLLLYANLSTWYMLITLNISSSILGDITYYVASHIYFVLATWCTYQVDMEETWTTSTKLLTTTAALITIYIIKTYIQKRSYPPGPWPLPVIGNLYQVARAGGVLAFYEKYRRIYGNVSYRTMRLHFVVIRICCMITA